jgi:hypothetical protein
MFSKIGLQNLDSAVGLPLRYERSRQNALDSGSAFAAELDGTFRFANGLLGRAHAQIGIGEVRVSAPGGRVHIQGLLKMRNCIRCLVFAQQHFADGNLGKQMLRVDGDSFFPIGFGLGPVID